MKYINSGFGISLDWASVLACELMGTKHGNFIYASPTIFSGVHYVTSISSEITVLFIRGCYNQDLHLQHHHQNRNFICFYIDILGNSPINFTYDKDSSLESNASLFNYSILDSTVEGSCEIIQKGQEVQKLYIFIKRDFFIQSLQKNYNDSHLIDNLFNEDNMFMRRYRINLHSRCILDNLLDRKINCLSFHFFIQSAVYDLIANYISAHEHFETIINEVVKKRDLIKIYMIQAYLVDIVKETFPSLESLAERIEMSNSKFKKLFKTVSGETPYSFFIHYKLDYAKNILRSNTIPIIEVVNLLNFPSSSRFSKLFRNHFGMLPSEYVKS